MNERIRELAKEHGFVRWDYDSLSYELKGDIEDLYAFAELIVRECVEQCNVNFVGTVGSHPSAHNRGVKKCIDNIKEHFGVIE